MASGSGTTSHWDRDQQFFEGSGIRLYHFCGIRDQQWSRLWNQGSEIWIQKWDQPAMRKKKHRYDPVIGREQFDDGKTLLTGLPYTGLEHLNNYSFGSGGKYPALFTDTEGYNCFSIYHTSQ